MDTEEKSILEKKARNVLDQIRPYLQQDGGDIQFISISDDNTLNVELQGACGSCPYSIITLKNGVETAVRKAIPEIKSVEAVNLNM